MTRKEGKEKTAEIKKVLSLKDVQSIEKGNWIKTTTSKEGTWFKVIKIHYDPYITNSEIPFFTIQEKYGYRPFVIDGTLVQLVFKGEINYKKINQIQWSCPSCETFFSSNEEILDEKELRCDNCSTYFGIEMFKEAKENKNE